MPPKYIQIHSLHSYPAALLNRDDSGLAKRLPYGNVVRTRISSQCLKRHWRMDNGPYSFANIEGAEDAIRSRDIIDLGVMRSIRESGNIHEDVLAVVEQAFHKGVYGESGTTRRARQPLLLGRPEVEYLRTKATEICNAHSDNAEAAEAAANLMFTKTERDNFRSFRETAALPGGLAGAMFGRMVTSDPKANIDAAIHVSHAFTVHGEETDSDYFSVVDDLQSLENDPGAAHIGEMELTAGLFYGYVVVDIPCLVSNLEGCKAADWQNADRTLTAKVVEHLLYLIATVSPGQKLGSTAPYTYADMVLVEAGPRQPRTLANAFRSPVNSAQVPDAMRRLSDHLQRIDINYGRDEERRVMCIEEDSPFHEISKDHLPEIATWTSSIIRQAEGA